MNEFKKEIDNINYHKLCNMRDQRKRGYMKRTFGVSQEGDEVVFEEEIKNLPENIQKEFKKSVM